MNINSYMENFTKEIIIFSVDIIKYHFFLLSGLILVWCYTYLKVIDIGIMSYSFDLNIARLSA